MLAQDQRPGAVLWFGNPVTKEGLRRHTFLVASSAHPDVNLSGRYNALTDVVQRDPFQLFCGDSGIPYCYLEPQLFSYLVHQSGAGYIVVPAGIDAGAIPNGITRLWLRQQVSTVFGAPTLLGSGDTQLLVWRVASPSPTVTSASAVALVDSGTWATPLALPALQALGLPAVYRQTFDKSHYPAAPASVPDSIRVLPRVATGCQGSSAATVAVMARSTLPSLTVNVAGTKQTLSALAPSTRVPGWSFYGPIQVSAGTTSISAPATTQLGPCVAWSPLTASALQGSATLLSATVASNGERITAPSAAGPWIELHRYYDQGWLLDQHHATAVGDGIFNLYHVGAKSQSSLSFLYSTLPYERIGIAASVVVLVVVVFLVVWDLRRRRVAVPSPDIDPLLYPSAAARWIAAVGMAMLAFTAAAVTWNWFGVPSIIPAAGFAPDPYDLDVGYGVTAVGILLLSLVVRLALHLVGVHERAARIRWTRAPLRLGAPATMIAVALLLTSCARPPDSLQNMLQTGPSGSSSSLEGGTLSDALVARASHEAQRCIGDYTQALGDFPDLAAAYAGRATCYLRGGKNAPAAVHDFTQALAFNPARTDLLLARAAAQRQSGDVAAALAGYEQAATLPAASPVQQLVAIDGMIGLFDTAQALATYQQVEPRNPSASALHLARADIATATGDDATAQVELDTALRLATTKRELALVRARLCRRDVLLHGFQQAMSDCSLAAQLSNRPSSVYDDLSAAELGLGNPTAALVDIDAAIGAWVGGAGQFAQPTGVDGIGLSSLYVARGWIEVQLNQSAAAVRDFQLAIAVLPTLAPDSRALIRADILTAQTD